MSVRYAYSRRPPSTISVYLADKALATLDCAGDGICSMSRDTSPAISMRMLAMWCAALCGREPFSSHATSASASKCALPT